MAPLEEDEKLSKSLILLKIGDFYFPQKRGKFAATAQHTNISEDAGVFEAFNTNSAEAIREAMRYYNNVDGCFYCCPESHRR